MPSFVLKKILAAFLVCLLAGCVSVAVAQDKKIIEEIQVHGNRRIPAETVRARLFTRPGDVYDEAAVQRDFNSLWNAGYFEDLRFEREDSPKGYRIHIYVKEKPTIRSIDYKNLSSVSTSDVLERFKDRKVGLSVESQFDPTKVKKAEVVLKELLAERGRQFATIRTEVRPIPPAAVGLTFVVKEGPKVKVGNIKFEGNKNLSSRELRASMKNLKPIGIPKSIFFENLFSRTYDSTKLEEDTERVRDAYQQKGYFKALVGDPTTKMRDTSGSFINPFARKPGKSVDITIPIEEGAKYRLGSITFKNGKAVTNVKALRSLIPMKDGEIFNIESMRTGLKNLRKAYGELGYIKFSPVPETKINEEKKIIDIEIDLDEGKPYSVRRIEFTGNTTTRDKVIRRELAVEEGNVYNSRLWEISLLRLNQLQYFEPLKPEKDSETKQNDQEGTVDLTLKVREKGKNSIGLTGGVSGLSGGFIGINYETNNFLGLGETLRVEANVGSRDRNVLFGFTEPYFLDRPLQFGFTVFSRKTNYNQAKNAEIQLQRQLNLPQSVLDQFQNFTQTTTGFTNSLSYPLRHSFKRIGITYSFDTTSVTAFTTASEQLFTQIAFRNISGPEALKGIITSKILPSFSWNTLNPSAQNPHSGTSMFMGGEISGIGGNVAAIRPIVEWKQFLPMHNFKVNKTGRNTLGYRVQGSFISGYRGLAAPPSERFFAGGENDLRGFDVRSISPYVFLTDKVNFPLVNPDGTPVPIDPTNPRRCLAGITTVAGTPVCGTQVVPIPIGRLIFPGGDTNLISNVEYRIPIAGPVTLAAFFDFGMNFVLRDSQLKLAPTQFDSLTSTAFGCTSVAPDPSNPVTFACNGVGTIPFSQDLKPAPGTNFVPRASTGLELQVVLPIINAPFRIYYAYNPLTLNTTIDTPSQITRDMFPAGAAGTFTYQRALQTLAPAFRLQEPKRTFRFSVATTF